MAAKTAPGRPGEGPKGVPRGCRWPLLVRVILSVIATVVVPVALLGLGLKEHDEFVRLEKLGHENVIVPLVGPSKSRLIVPVDCPDWTTKVNGGEILCGINLLATMGREKGADFVKSATA